MSAGAQGWSKPGHPLRASTLWYVGLVRARGVRCSDGPSKEVLMPSDAALLLADLVEDPKAFPDEAVDALQTLLGDRLVRLDPGAHRWDLLHALVTLIRESNGTAPTAAQ